MIAKCKLVDTIFQKLHFVLNAYFAYPMEQLYRRARIQVYSFKFQFEIHLDRGIFANDASGPLGAFSTKISCLGRNNAADVADRKLKTELKILNQNNNVPLAPLLRDTPMCEASHPHECK